MLILVTSGGTGAARGTMLWTRGRSQGMVLEQGRSQRSSWPRPLLRTWNFLSMQQQSDRGQGLRGRAVGMEL